MKVILAIAVVCFAAVVCEGYKIVAPRPSEFTIQPYGPRPRPFWLGYPNFPFTFPQSAQPSAVAPIEGTEDSQIEWQPEILPENVDFIHIVAEDQNGDDEESSDSDAENEADSDDSEDVNRGPDDEEAQESDDDIEEIE